MAGEFATRTRERLRHEVLDAAEELVLARGWRGLRMQAIAARVGVSRQTVYNEFVNKDRLARALALRLADRMLDGVDTALLTGDDLRSAWSAAARQCLRAASEDPLLKAMLSGEDGSSADFLPLLTSDAGVVTLARRRIAATVCRRWPALDPDRVAVAAEAAIRLVISHIVLPLHPAEEVAEQTSWLVSGFLGPAAEAAPA